MQIRERERRWGRRSRIRLSLSRDARTNKLSRRGFVALHARPMQLGFPTDVKGRWKKKNTQCVADRMNHRGSFDVTSIFAQIITNAPASAFRDDMLFSSKYKYLQFRNKFCQPFDTIAFAFLSILCVYMEFRLINRFLMTRDYFLRKEASYKLWLQFDKR